MNSERHPALELAGQAELQRLQAKWPSRVSNLNTRRHPRTLAEAWPQHYAWQGVITRHRRPLAQRVWDCIFTVLLSTACAVGAFLYLAR
jgi:hypothetical protein